jgi:hypothetical protein
VFTKIEQVYQLLFIFNRELFTEIHLKKVISQGIIQESNERPN